MRIRPGVVAKWVAVFLGMANAAVTGYWLASGTALLSTVDRESGSPPGVPIGPRSGRA